MNRAAPPMDRNAAGMNRPAAGAADSLVALAQPLDVGIVIIAGDTVAGVNAALLRAFEVPPDRSGPDALGIVGSTVASLSQRKPWRQAADFWRALQREPGKPHRCTLPGDRVVTARWHPLPSDGEVPLLAAVFGDATGDVRVRRRLREQNRALAEIVATKTELVSALLHELRTPLAAALSMAELVPEQTGDSLVDEALALIVRKLRRIDEVTTEIATISGIENGTVNLDRVPFNLPDLLTVVAGESGARIETQPQCGFVVGDRDWIGRVVSRLIAAVGALAGEVPTVSADLVGDRWRVALPLPGTQGTDRLFTAAGSSGNSTALMLARAVVGRHGGKVGVETVAHRPYLVIWIPRGEPQP
jgi:signal transduction histidine kinase